MLVCVCCLYVGVCVLAFLLLSMRVFRLVDVLCGVCMCLRCVCDMFV